MGVAEIGLAADLGEIERMNDWLAEHCNVDEQVFQRLKLCLNEAVENVIRYGDAGAGAHEIELRLDCRNNCAAFELRDSGRAFDPLHTRPRQAYDDLATAEIGGFGLVLMKEAASEIAYERKSGRNVLTARFCPR
jgi:anti-sigma regulatory factor (Ser/Thr protein kinase)